MKRHNVVEVVFHVILVPGHTAEPVLPEGHVHLGVGPGLGVVQVIAAEWKDKVEVATVAESKDDVLNGTAWIIGLLTRKTWQRNVR